MSRSASAARACAVVCVVASACGEAGGAADPTGATVLEITDVPAGVLCLRFSVQSPGAAAVAVDRDVAGGGAATVNLGALPGGNTVLSAQAFTAACAGVTTATAPAWIATPQTFSLRAGYRNEIELTFRPNAGVSVGGSFVAPARAIALGARTAYALGEDGVVRARGLNDQGQLGAGAAGPAARRRDGSVWCRGSNDAGQVGDGTLAVRYTPVPVLF